jgi:hypothetical protein
MNREVMGFVHMDFPILADDIESKLVNKVIYNVQTVTIYVHVSVCVCVCVLWITHTIISGV